MKTENFDDSIRSKLESDLPLYRDGELDRVQNYVNQNQTKDSGKRLLLFSIVSLAGLLLAGLLIWDMNQFEVNKQLNQTIASLKSSIAEKKKFTNNNTLVPESASRPASESMKKQHASDQRVAALIESNRSKENNQKVINSEDKNHSEELVNSGQSGPDIKPEVYRSDDKFSSDSVKTMAVEEHVTAPAVVPVAEKHTHYLAGAGIEVANGHNAVSIVGEMMLGRNWGVSTGIKIVQIDEDGNFFDNEDFESKKGHDFSAPCTTCSVDSGAHQDVHYKYTLLQIPLALNYYIHLNNNFALSPGLGTNLDIYAKEQPDMDNFPTGIPTNVSWTNRCPVLAFNNVKFSMGIQKQWKHFVFKAIPSVSKQLTAVEYKAESVYYGFELRGLYSF